MKKTILLLLLSTDSLAATEVSLMELVAYATTNSSQATLINAQNINRNGGILRNDATLGSKMTSKLSFLDNRNENTTGSFSPNTIKASSLSMGYRNLLPTGTTFGVDIVHQLNDLAYQSSTNPAIVTPDGQYTETTSSVFIRQKLLANAFGTATEARAKAAQASSEAILRDSEVQMESYIRGLIQQYFNVWLMQTNYRAAIDRLKRQEYLLKVTRIKQRRGTAEDSEVLQLESAVIQSKEMVADVKHNLSNIWRRLVVSLGLPKSYAAIDATTVKLKVASRVQEMQSHCINGQAKPSRSEKALGLNIDASIELMSAIKSQTKPDIFVEARLSGNGIDEASSTSFSESMSLKHPQWSVAIGVDWPFGFNREKADYLDALSRKTRLSASLDAEKTNSRIERLNSCAKLERDAEKTVAYKIVLKKQKRRNQLEEKRFALGQTPLINVIQSGNDITAAEVNLQTARVQMEVSSWDAVAANGLLSNYIENAVATIAAKGSK